MKELKVAAILSYLNLFVTNVVGIFLTPYMIEMLGNSEYGLYTLIGAFVGYMSILDLGLNNAIIRFVAQYRIEQDKKGEESFIAVTLILYGVLAILISLFGLLFYLNMERYFGNTLSVSEMIKGKTMMAILIFNIAISLPGGAFAGICSGYEKFVFVRLLNLVKYILRALLLVALLWYKGDSVSIVILDTIMNIFFIVVSMFYVFSRLKVVVKLHTFNWSLLSTIFNYSIWIFVFALVYQFQWRTGQVILGARFNTNVVAIYGVGVMLGIYYTTFGNVINGLFLPRAVHFLHQGMTPRELTNKMIDIGRVSAVLLLYVLGAFAITGRNFIHLWVGDNYSDSYLIALLIMTVYFFPLSQGFGHSILEAKKLLRFKALAFLVFTLSGTVVGAFLANYYGSIGMITGLVFGLVLLQNVMNFYFHRIARLNMFLFFKNTYAELVIPGAFIFFLCRYLNSFFSISWRSFVVENIIYTILFCATVYLIYFTAREKHIIKSAFKL